MANSGMGQRNPKLEIQNPKETIEDTALEQSQKPSQLTQNSPFDGFDSGKARLIM
jgi:hypothetical protein